MDLVLLVEVTQLLAQMFPVAISVQLRVKDVQTLAKGLPHSTNIN